jgi:hypothetical protein
VHPADGETRHELYLMCDDIHATLAGLRDSRPGPEPRAPDGGCQASATETGVKSRPGSPGGSWAP